MCLFPSLAVAMKPWVKHTLAGVCGRELLALEGSEKHSFPVSTALLLKKL
jgi:hypothetical protein